LPGDFSTCCTSPGVSAGQVNRDPQACLAQAPHWDQAERGYAVTQSTTKPQFRR